MGKRLTQSSFTGGELAPSLYARNDIAKYGTGLRILKNGFSKAEGGALNRAGLEFVCKVKDKTKKTRLIPFSFNTEQTYIIESGAGYFRYIKDGGQIVYPEGHAQVGQIVETSNSYQESDIFMQKYAQNADVLSICHNSYKPAELTRTDHHIWTLSDIAISPEINAPSGVAAVRQGSTGTPTRVYKYVVTAIKQDSYEESVISSEVSCSAHYESSWEADEKVHLTWTAVAGATEYKIYKAVNGVFGYIGTAVGAVFDDDNIEPDLKNTAPVFRNPFDGAGNYPATVNYFQQRRVFANTNNKPQSLFSTQTGLMNNFNISRPLLATNAITTNISEREVHEIRHIVAMNDLVLLTVGGEWRVNGSDGIFQATPPPVAKLQSNNGCSNVMPIVSGSMILYVQAGGSVVRDLGYTYVSDSYDGDELSLLANHLFEGKQVIEWGYAKEPYRIIWAVMSDGTLNGLTYNPKQEVIGWHRHVTDGKFESVAVIREGFEDVPYFVINRTINGVEERYIERMKSRIVNNAKDGFFVDSGLMYEGTPVSSISGLEHLEGKEVIVLADGGVITGKTVSGGSVSLGVTASKIIVGLPYEFEFKTLNFEGEATQGLKKKINKYSVKVDKSRPDFFVCGSDGQDYQLERPIESINDSGYLFSGDVNALVLADYSTDAYVHIKQKYPLPLTILSVSPEVDVENVQ